MAESRPISEGFYPCVQGTKIGYRRVQEPSLIIPAQYDEAYRFHQGRALVRIGKRYGFIDTYGKLVIPAVYTSASPFSNELSLVREEKSLYPFLINKDGSVFNGVDYGKYRILFAPTEGLIAARLHGTSKCGFLDLNGQEAIPFSYYHIYAPFTNGIANIERKEGYGDEYINRQGAYVDYDASKNPNIENSIAGLKVFSVPYEEVYAKYGFVNGFRRIVCPPVFLNKPVFKDGLAEVRIGTRNWISASGYCDMWGNTTIDHLIK